MLTGYSAEETEPFSLPEDPGPVRTVFHVRPIPRGKLDELTAKAVDHHAAEKRDGDHVVKGRQHNREIVRWGIAKHECLVSQSGKQIPCDTVESSFCGEKFQVLRDDVLDRYERTLVRRATVPATEDGPAGEDGAPLWKKGESVLAQSDGPLASGGAPKWRKGEPIFFEVTLLDVLADRVTAEQSLSAAERRSLPGAGVAAG